MSVQENVLEATVSEESISRVFLSGGTLTAQDAVTVSLPGEVQIKSYAVQSGDSVQAGDVIATVEKSSVLSSVRSIQTVMAELDEALGELTEDNDAKVAAAAAGRLKLIYAEAGTPVADTMAQYGALAVLSLDGLMSAEIPAGSLNVGDSVTVLLPDGSEEAGRVEAIRDGTATVTLSDENAEYGDRVTVRAEDGSALGAAAVTIHSPLKITGYQGVVEALSVETGDTVSAGDTVLTLKNETQSPEYTNLLRQRKTLSEQMRALFELYQTGEIVAAQSGEISAVNEDLMQLSAEGGDYQLVLLSNNPVGVSEDGVMNYAARVISADGTALTLQVDPQPLGEIDYTAVSGLDPARCTQDASVTLPGAVSVFTWDGSQWHADGASGIRPGELMVFSYDAQGNLLWIVRTQTAPPDNPDLPDNPPDQPDDPDQPDNPDRPDNPDQPDNPGKPDDPGKPDNPNQSQTPGNQSDPNGQQTFPSGSGMPSTSGSPFGSGSSGFSGGSMQMPSGTYGSSDPQTAEATEPVYSVEESAVYRLTPCDTMTIEFTADELDIRSLAIGQQAEVTLDALPGQSFTGEITAIDAEGSYEEGNTKYQVTVTVARAEQMLSGMNAGIKVALGEPTQCTAIPEAALIEKSGKTYVYTSYDPEHDLLAGLTEIETGISDGTSVQVLSGLPEGATVFYRYADSIKYSFIRP